MGVQFKFTASSGSAIDLTSVSVNPGAQATSTPRQGGFTLRNRINFANVGTANKTLWTIDASSVGASQVSNKLRVLEVPNRTLVRDVRVMNVVSGSVPATSVTFATAASVGSSAFSGAVIQIGAEINSKPTSSASYAAASHLDLVTGTDAGSFNDAKAGAALGCFPLTKKTLAITRTLLKVDSSIASVAGSFGGMFMPGTTVNSESDPAFGAGVYFPYGGWVTLAMGPHNTALGSATASKVASGSSDASLQLAGVWEIQANANYIPE